MAQTFSIFSRLPTELRLRIWHFAFDFFPRVIELIPSEKPDCTVRYRRWEALASSTLTLLQVNREVRYEFLPQYSSPFNPRGIEPYHPKSLLINYETDTIYVRVDIMSHALPPRLFWRDVCEGAEAEMKNKLKSLAGNDTFWNRILYTNSGDAQAGFREFEDFKKLQRVTVVGPLEQRLVSLNGSPRLERLEECPPRGTYEAAYVPWFTESFASASRSAPVVITLCREVEKVERDAAL